MDCDEHTVTNPEIVSVEDTAVTIEAECASCGRRLWSSTKLNPVADVSVGDRFRGPDGNTWTVMDDTRPGHKHQSGSPIADLDDPLDQRRVGVHIETYDLALWWTTARFEHLRGDIYQECG
ncbi:hypothetical protein [Halocatena halophila]|uniref:hypothetical protein n=1 Tax=Halocatena halophila TaxID=2814576 RepID=UPI002ED516E6